MKKKRSVLLIAVMTFLIVLSFGCELVLPIVTGSVKVTVNVPHSLDDTLEKIVVWAKDKSGNAGPGKCELTDGENVGVMTLPAGDWTVVVEAFNIGETSAVVKTEKDVSITPSIESALTVDLPDPEPVGDFTLSFNRTPVEYIHGQNCYIECSIELPETSRVTLLIDDTPVECSIWTDGDIDFVIPKDLDWGYHTVVVVVEENGQKKISAPYILTVKEGAIISGGCRKTDNVVNFGVLYDWKESPKGNLEFRWYIGHKEANGVVDWRPFATTDGPEADLKTEYWKDIGTYRGYICVEAYDDDGRYFYCWNRGNIIHNTERINGKTEETVELCNNESREVTLTLTSSYVDLTKYSFEWYMDDKFIEGSSSNILKYTFGSKDEGKHKLKVKVVDPDGGYNAEKMFPLTVYQKRDLDLTFVEGESLENCPLERDAGYTFKIIGHVEGAEYSLSIAGKNIPFTIENGSLNAEMPADVPFGKNEIVLTQNKDGNIKKAFIPVEIAESATPVLLSDTPDADGNIRFGMKLDLRPEHNLEGAKYKWIYKTIHHGDPKEFEVESNGDASALFKIPAGYSNQFWLDGAVMEADGNVIRTSQVRMEYKPNLVINGPDEAPVDPSSIVYEVVDRDNLMDMGNFAYTWYLNDEMILEEGWRLKLDPAKLNDGSNVLRLEGSYEGFPAFSVEKTVVKGAAPKL